MQSDILKLPDNFSLSLLDVSGDVSYDFAKFGPDSHFHILQNGSVDILMEALVALTMEKFNQNDEGYYSHLEEQFIRYCSNFGISNEEAMGFVFDYVNRFVAIIISYFGAMISHEKPDYILSLYKLTKYLHGMAFFEKREVFDMNKALGR